MSETSKPTSVLPTDEEIVAYVVEHYSRDMAESVLAALRSTDHFGEHVRRSFQREMTEGEPERGF